MASKCWNPKGCPFNSNNSPKYLKCWKDEYTIEQCKIDNWDIAWCYDGQVKNCSGNSCSDEDGSIVFYNENIQKIYEYAKEQKYEASRDCFHEASNAFSMIINFIEENFK